MHSRASVRGVGRLGNGSLPKRRFGVLVALLAVLLLIAGLLAAPSASAAPGFKYTVEQDGFGPVEITPFAGGATGVASFYSYDVPCAFSANTGLEISQTSQLFLYSGPGGLSIVVIHDRPEGCLGEAADGGQVNFTYSGLPVGSVKAVGDDPGEGNIPNASWLWFACCTDGNAVLLPQVCDFEITIRPDFIDGIDRWIARSGPAGGDIVGFPNLEDPVTIKCIRVVDIDIKPGSDPNSIKTSSRGLIPVAVLSAEDFDATTVDPSTLAFGPDGAAPAHDPPGHLEDVNDDGLVDLVAHFRTQETGIAGGDTEACLTGETFDGIPFEGCDAIKTPDP